MTQPPPFEGTTVQQVNKKGFWFSSWKDIELEHRPDLDVSALFIELDEQFGDRCSLSQRKQMGGEMVILSETDWRGVAVLARHSPKKNVTRIEFQRIIPRQRNVFMLLLLLLLLFIAYFIALGVVLGKSDQIEGEVAAFLAQSPLIEGTKRSPSIREIPAPS